MQRLERITNIPKRYEKLPENTLYDVIGFRHENAEKAAEAFADKNSCVYGRIAHPNTNALAQIYRDLEGGEDAVILSSGMAATTTLVLALCTSGDYIVSSNRIYGGTYTLFEKFLPAKNNIYTEFVSEPDNFASWESVRDLHDKPPKLFFLETPGNPLLGVYDIGEIAKLAHSYGAPLVVDNTMGLGIQKPLELGADVSLSSLTKVATRGKKTGGVIIGSKQLIENCLDVRKNIGACMDHEVAFEVTKDACSIAQRMKRHSENAFLLAYDLACRGYQVYYPGFANEFELSLVNKQMGGYGGVLLSFDVEGGQSRAMRLLNILHDEGILDIVTHFGEDKITTGVHPASTTHSGMDKEAREKAGISDGLLRISADANRTFKRTTLKRFMKALDVFEKENH
ncbi:aminotransferase class I/II-fold pyridoxal phosphate-dependent enzyme [Candidatus Daviesbacteria bacterium]|nr:aminotransferase class I/II-fold pyridoxal phosphate-dependent enzyme [Candidatus Daviesbacteria bacterium]